MPGIDAVNCNTLLESIRVSMHEISLSWHSELVNITFSVEVTDRIAISLSSMISNAEVELYRAK